MIQAKYELLTRGSYLMNQDATRLKIKPLEPGSPLDLAEARNAVELARLAGADRYASDTFDKAGALLATAEEARREASRQQCHPDGGSPGCTDGRGCQARGLAAARGGVQGRGASHIGGERARRECACRGGSSPTPTGRVGRAQRSGRAGLGRAERSDGRPRSRPSRRVRRQMPTPRGRPQTRRGPRPSRRALRPRRRAAMPKGKPLGRKTRSPSPSARRRSSATAFVTQLNLILETRETARGLIVNVSDVLFDTGKADLKPGAREKLARISGILGIAPRTRAVSRRAHRQRGLGRIQPAVVRAPRGVGPRVPGRPADRSGVGRGHRSW